MRDRIERFMEDIRNRLAEETDVPADDALTAFEAAAALDWVKAEVMSGQHSAAFSPRFSRHES